MEGLEDSWEPPSTRVRPRRVGPRLCQTTPSVPRGKRLEMEPSQQKTTVAMRHPLPADGNQPGNLHPKHSGNVTWWVTDRTNQHTHRHTRAEDRLRTDFNEVNDGKGSTSAAAAVAAKQLCTCWSRNISETAVCHEDGLKAKATVWHTNTDIFLSCVLLLQWQCTFLP